MSRRHRKFLDQEPRTDETWLIPYADMLTLLLALFIILFASSNLDVQKFEEMMESFSAAFQGESAAVGGPPPPPPEGGTSSVTPPPILPDTDEGELEREMEDLRRLQQQINTYIEQNDLQLSLKTELTEGGLIITILEHALFDSGSAVVKPESVQLAREIANLLVMDPPRHVQIIGHTDNVPIHNRQFRHNWDLSAMRGINFLSIILENAQLDPIYFSFAGHGEYQPVATNDTAAGRQQNRRVEVKILPNVKERSP